MSSSWFSAGFQFGLGLGCAAIVVSLVLTVFKPAAPKDDSDPSDGRSGVAVVTDYRTGLQYLRAPGGGITQRIGVDGEQIREGQ